VTDSESILSNYGDEYGGKERKSINVRIITNAAYEEYTVRHDIFYACMYDRYSNLRQSESLSSRK
jgi:hypothetical protein